MCVYTNILSITVSNGVTDLLVHGVNREQRSDVAFVSVPQSEAIALEQRQGITVDPDGDRKVHQYVLLSEVDAFVLPSAVLAHSLPLQELGCGPGVSS